MGEARRRPRSVPAAEVARQPREESFPKSTRAGFDTIGCYGEKLSEHWTDGMSSLHGMHVHGFPNLFILGFAQGANLIASVTHNYVEGGTTIAALVRHAIER
jgi:cation diffusion facilitator CzcD-associated flavoprotein CzcO